MIESEGNIINLYYDALLGNDKETTSTNDFSVVINDGNMVLPLGNISMNFKPAPYMSIIPVD